MAFVPEFGDQVRPSGYAHVVLKSAQIEKMIDWYEKVIGLKVVLETPIITFMTFDHSQDRLALIRSEHARSGRGASLDHIAYEYSSLDDLVKVYRRAQAMGVHPHWSINHGVATSIYYHDPDGNDIETSVTHFHDRETVNRWLAEGGFDLNPIGVSIDCETLARRVESGDMSDLLKPHAGHGEALQSELALMQTRVGPRG